MKKIVILCLAVAMLLVGCNKEKTPGPTPSPSPDGTPGASELQSFGYTTGALASVIFTDLEKGISVDLSANGVLKAGLKSAKYRADEKKANAGEAVYELKMDGKSLYIYPENVVAYNGSDPYPCREFNVLSYLNGLFAGEVTTLGGYDVGASIKVKNKQGLVAEVEDKADFFTELGKVKIIKMANAADYTVQDVEYTVAIGEEAIKICGNYLKIGEDLYAVAQGDFAFLSEYAFSSSSDGFLPWI